MTTIVMVFLCIQFFMRYHNLTNFMYLIFLVTFHVLICAYIQFVIFAYLLVIIYTLYA